MQRLDLQPYNAKTDEVFQKMGETNKSILSLNNVFDLKKKVLFNLNVLKKPFGWVALFLSIFLFVFYIGKKEFIVFFVE